MNSFKCCILGSLEVLCNQKEILQGIFYSKNIGTYEYFMPEKYPENISEPRQIGLFRIDINT